MAGHRIPAGTSVLNGAGEMTGRIAIDEWGMLETPIFLTSSMAIGRVYDGADRRWPAPSRRGSRASRSCRSSPNATTAT